MPCPSRTFGFNVPNYVRCPHRRKSQLVRSGDRAGHRISPYLKIPLFGNKALKVSIEIRAVCAKTSTPTSRILAITIVSYSRNFCPVSIDREVQTGVTHWFRFQAADQDTKVDPTFAREHVHKEENWWDVVMFADESKFNVFGSDGQQYVWYKKMKISEKESVANSETRCGQRHVKRVAANSSSGPWLLRKNLSTEMSDDVVLIATDCAVNVYYDYDVKLGE
ncbi:hypothetical protein ANN_22770 [Periplaneta americana]|uniref:Uncharacterized protein n=1 Tax=Periplaneta americana TaxID=6978 RepID=A0ABQ8SKG9_PERAM|nr:hypothetical protein ANN_22770 [Periplaneta americana]